MKSRKAHIVLSFWRTFPLISWAFKYEDALLLAMSGVVCNRIDDQYMQLVVSLKGLMQVALFRVAVDS